MVMDPSTGVLFNNEMDDFSFTDRNNSFDLSPGPNNLIKPLKRPFSSSTPVIVLDNNDVVRVIIGAAGGSFILSSALQAKINTLHSL
jgi:gamma-glutamyltranspeptidase / glutathione hydrolase